MSKGKRWSPINLLETSHHSYSVVILNVPIENKKNLIHICSKATQIVAADGGANRIFDLEVTEQERAIITPSAIVGDLDSIRNDVKQHYEAAGITFEYDPDLYSTDFTKSLKHIRKFRKTEQETVIAFGGLGGRPDQAFAQLHQLCVAAQDSNLVAGDLYLFTNEGVLFLLEEGLNTVDTSRWPDLVTENIGIIPIGKPAIISTKGLEWDVTDWHTSFDTQVSTSNHIRAPEVTVTTSERLFFTMEFAELE